MMIIINDQLSKLRNIHPPGREIYLKSEENVENLFLWHHQHLLVDCWGAQPASKTNIENKSELQIPKPHISFSLLENIIKQYESTFRQFIVTKENNMGDNPIIFYRGEKYFPFNMKDKIWSTKYISR